MKKENISISYIVTRAQKRAIARKKMAEAGIKHSCRHGYTTNKVGFTNFYSRTPSYFAQHWKEYVEV